MYHFKQGTKMRIQLLPKDGTLPQLSAFRPSNDQRDVTISNVDIRVPVREAPGSLDGLVKAPSKKVLPAGYELATEFQSIGSLTIEQYISERNTKPPEKVGKIRVVGNPTVKGKQLTARVNCAAVNTSCSKARVAFKGLAGKGKGVTLATRAGVTVQAGKTVTVKFKLTAKARKLFKDGKKRKAIRKKGKKRVRVVKVKGLKKLKTRVLIAGKASGNVVVKRNGKVR